METSYYTTEEYKTLLRGARKRTVMETTYAITDGPIVPEQSGGRIRVTRVEVRTDDTGWREVSVHGRSVTKDGREKSSRDYFYAHSDIAGVIAAALLEL